jgi:gliding motility-associated-like protein
LNKYRLLLLFLMLTLMQESEARHIAGGEMSYEYLGDGSQAGSGRYRITLRLYRDCQSTGSALDQTAAITIFQTGFNAVFRDLQVPISRTETAQLSTPGPCISNAPAVCYQIGVYYAEVELPFSANGFTVTYQRCCRIENITNVASSNNAGATYTATIPGTASLSSAPKNSSPIFRGSDTVLICQDNPFFYDFGATDPDGDSLVYVYEQAYNFAQNGSPQPPMAGPPPYNSLNYSFGFTADQPMGPSVRLSYTTGLMGGTAPAAGIYVVTVAVLEYRNGMLINRHRKDLHIKVAPCSIAAADLQPEYINCEDFTITFQNLNNSPLIRNYHWDFNIPGRTNDTSDLARPTISFPDTGVYQIRLITNRNEDCTDTAYAVARVFPRFNAGFEVLQTCRNIPFSFRDTSNATFGTVNYWRWSFGNPSINPDTSALPSPQYTYPTTGSFQTQLIVATSKGCRDTIDRTITVTDRPSLFITNDTLMCVADTMQLSAIGIGTVKWSPSIGLDNPDSPTPRAYPGVPTKYFVTLTTAPGCVAYDSVFLDVRQFVSLDAGQDTTICLGDSITLTPLSDGLTFRWSPTGTLNDSGLKSPVAKPGQTTTYQVSANIGTCAATDAIRVTTVPYPTVSISPSVELCFGDSTTLFATGGVDYRWSPSSGLSSTIIPDPIARPQRSTTYRVAIRDNKGCPKPSFDTIRVNVLPRVPAFAGRDTVVVVGQPLSLNASGGFYYLWTPPDGLNNPNIKNPVADLNDDTRLILKVTTLEGCYAYDTLNIRVFKTEPDIFVPTAFTPNNDGLNDLLTPIPVGVESIDFFRIHNRWGQEVFATDKIGKGWDGKLSGREQGTDTFVWQVRGKDFLGRIIYKKGTVTLIR